MSHPQSTYCVLLTWVGIGMMVCGLALAPILTIYIKQQSNSVKTTTTSISTTITTSQTSSSSLTTQGYYCGNTSSFTLWRTFSTNGITMLIDTSICNFSSTPLYFTSMAGTSEHWILTGYDAIYVPTQSSLTIYAQSSSITTSAQLLSYSQTYQWSVNWFGLCY